MNKMNIDDYLTHISRPDDLPFLRTKLLDVNVRLFKSNDKYREIILKCCELIQFCCLNKFDGYKLPHGMSGANVGIPFNIIGISKKRGTENAYCTVLINPQIVRTGNKLVETDSNCGSIRLEKSIKIVRKENIMVDFYKIIGLESPYELIQSTAWFGRDDGSLTIQHEIDHNNGILITDYQKYE